MGACISMDLPVDGSCPPVRMLRGNWGGKVLGSGSDVWKYWAEKQAGRHHRGGLEGDGGRASPAPSAPA
jgi:hypothetical protein